MRGRRAMRVEEVMTYDGATAVNGMVSREASGWVHGMNKISETRCERIKKASCPRLISAR